MAKILAGVLSLALLPSALAFQNTSPFFLFSTSDFLSQNAGLNSQIAAGKHLTSQIRHILGEACPSSIYIVVQQDGVSSADFSDRSSAPRLASYMAGQQGHIKTQISIPEVVGRVDTDLIVEDLIDRCGAKFVEAGSAEQPSRPSPQILMVSRHVPASGGHAQTITAQDRLLEKAISEYGSSSDYTVIYATSPIAKEAVPSAHNEPAYEMEDPFGEAVRMELKRDTTSARRADKRDDGGLFEKYQFFTPGIFMGFSAMVPLVLILGIGLRAIANLEVSYFAFSKEMGPTAQKKQ